MKHFMQVVRILILTLAFMTIFAEIVQAQNIHVSHSQSMEVLTELNSARQNPKAYADKLTARLSHFNGLNYEIAPNVTIKTQEGAAAVQEAIQFLSSQKALAPLTVSAGMCKAALLLVNDQSITGHTGHSGSDGSDPFSRISQFGDWDISAGENIAYGQSTAEDIVMGLIIDDGVATRGHRANIFNSQFRVVGIASGVHKSEHKTMCAMDFAGAYTEKY